MFLLFVSALLLTYKAIQGPVAAWFRGYILKRTLHDGCQLRIMPFVSENLHHFNQFEFGRGRDLFPIPLTGNDQLRYPVGGEIIGFWFSVLDLHPRNKCCKRVQGRFRRVSAANFADAADVDLVLTHVCEGNFEELFKSTRSVV